MCVSPAVPTNLSERTRTQLRGSRGSPPLPPSGPWASLAWALLGAQRWCSTSDKEDVSPSPLRAARVHRTFRCRAVLALLGALVAVLGAASFGLLDVPAASADTWTPVHPGDFPDPSILSYGGAYYAFATQNFAAPGQTINIQVSTSSDGVNWSQLNGVDALPSVGS